MGRVRRESSSINPTGIYPQRLQGPFEGLSDQSGWYTSSATRIHADRKLTLSTQGEWSRLEGRIRVHMRLHPGATEQGAIYDRAPFLWSPGLAVFWIAAGNLGQALSGVVRVLLSVGQKMQAMLPAWGLAEPLRGATLVSAEYIQFWGAAVGPTVIGFLANLILRDDAYQTSGADWLLVVWIFDFTAVASHHDFEKYVSYEPLKGSTVVVFLALALVALIAWLLVIKRFEPYIKGKPNGGKITWKQRAVFVFGFGVAAAATVGNVMAFVYKG